MHHQHVNAEESYVYVVKHLEDSHYRLSAGKFVVALPFKSDVGTLEESMSTAVWRFLSLKR